MIVPYYFVDLIATVSQAMIIFVAVNGLCRTIRMEYCRMLLPIIWFIKPLDISTLFGNGIDNVIEASEKLSKEQRVILI